MIQVESAEAEILLRIQARNGHGSAVLGRQLIGAVIDTVAQQALVAAELEPDLRSRERDRKTGFRLFGERVAPHAVVREITFRPVARRTNFVPETTFQRHGSSSHIYLERHVASHRKVLPPVAEQVEFHVGVPIQISFHVSLYGTVDIGAVAIRSLVRTHVVLQAELVVMVGVVPDPGVDHADGSVPVPRLNLHEQAVGKQALENRVVRPFGTDIPVFVEIAAFRFRIGIPFIKATVQERITEEDRRIPSDREILVGQLAQRYAIRLDDIERIVLEQIPGIVEPNVE